MIMSKNEVLFVRKSLNMFTPGEKGRVVRVSGEGVLRRRLFDMGITPGAEITMRKAAPLGDPIELTIRGYELSVRKAEAEAVLMEVDER
jgi:Fe2+ transport system protein FeoA